jgi:hypothetical protein
VFPWYSAAMLALEANHVIALRLSKMAFGGWRLVPKPSLWLQKNSMRLWKQVAVCSKTGTFRRLLLVIVNTCRQMPIVSL